MCKILESDKKIKNYNITLKTIFNPIKKLKTN